MSPQNRFRLRWWYWVLLGVSTVSAVLLSLVWQNRSARDELVASIRTNVEKAGGIIAIGRVERHLDSTVVRDLQITSKNAPGYSASVRELVLPIALFGNRNATVRGIHLTLTGEPSTLFDSLPSAKLISAAVPGVRILDMSAEYLHRFFGRITLEGLRLESRESVEVVSAARVKLDHAQWDNVTLAVRRRNKMIEVGLGDGTIDGAKAVLGYFESSRGASQWVLTINRQSVRAFGKNLGWDPGPAFDATSVGGSITFLIPNDPALKIRGSIQAAFDLWPRPPWPESEALMGNTTSVFARIDPSADGRKWELSKVSLSQSLYTMEGVGRLDWGEKPRLAFDVRGARNCAQLGSHLPPSTYQNSVKRYLENSTANSVQPGSKARQLEEVAIHLQASTENSANGLHHSAWEMTAGCGLAELRTGSFMALDLPPILARPADATNRQE